MISKIILTNYRSYSKFEKVFSDELNVIQGRNATGKSTIVEAIGYALQGSALQKGKGTSWIKEGTSEASVSLYIDDYIITRGNKKQIVTDNEGNILARGHTGINEWVYETYGLLPELYKTSFHIAQKEISAFAALGPIEKTKRVEKLLKLDIIDDIKKRAQEKKRTLSGGLSVLKSQKEQLADVDLEELNKLKEDKIVLEKDIETSKELQIAQNERVTIYNMKVQSYNKKVALEQRLFDKNMSMEENADEIKKIENTIEENAGLAVASKLYNEKCALEKELNNIDINEKYFTSDIRQIMDLRNILMKSAKASDELNELVDFIPSKKLKVSDDILQELYTEYSKTQDTLKELESTPDICPTCNQAMPDMTVKIKSLKKKVSKLREDYVKAKGNLKYNKLMEDIYDGDETLSEVNVMIDSLKFRDKYLRLQEMADIKKPVKEPVSTAYLNAKLTDLKADRSIHTRLLEYVDVEMPERLNDLKNYVEILKKLSNSLNHTVNSISRIEGLIEQLEKLLTDISIAEDKVDNITGFIKFIANYREAFSSKIIPMLEENANKIINYLSEGKLKNLNLDSNYVIGGYDMYSGSEEDSANFALRLAIAQISRLGNYNTIVLDEIASSYDSVREDKLLEILKSTNMQVIYISHGDINY